MAQPPRGEPAPLDGALPFAGDAQTEFSVYLHIPFCEVRCGYCDFNTYTATELRGVTRSSFVDDLLKEIELSGRLLDESGTPKRKISTVFFGGGTPSLLPAVDVEKIIDTLEARFGIEDDAEVTLEANPDTVTPGLATGLRRAGVNRLSIGMQSSSPSVLKTLDRTHQPEAVQTAVAAAKSSGMQTSVDLIYGTPGETMQHWEKSLSDAIALETDHISAYSLIVEAGTALHRKIRSGEIADIDEDFHAEGYEVADRMLTSAGFEWYEISNWSRGSESVSRHNLAYWTGGDWWGYGPGAHSHLNGARWWNVKHPAAYAERLAAGDSPAHERELLSAADKRIEAIMLGIRLREGIQESLVSEEQSPEIPALIAEELIDGRKAIAGTIVLTDRGRLLADLVVRRLT